MTNSPDLTKFQQKLAERRAKAEAEKRAATRAAQSSTPDHDDDLIPDHPYETSDADLEMDRIIKGIDILDAYARWCGKMQPKSTRGKREGIKISCPIPTHPDKDPSAWINLDKQTWFCGGCQVGGDAYDIAAFHFNYPVPGYKDGSQFHELRRDMASDFGYTFTTMPGGVTVITPPVEDDEGAGRIISSSFADDSTTGDVKPQSDKGAVIVPEPDTSDESGEQQKADADIIELYDDDDEAIVMPGLAWEVVVPKGTFLDAYMQQTTQDDVPEEYHFWNSLLALGFALGRDVRLHDLVPVYGNLFICTLGPSGSGKSKARYHLDQLLTSALPHDWSDPNSKGVRKVSTPGSAEVLIHNFQKPVTDPADPKKVIYHAPVRGMIDFNELSALIARTNRQGNATVPALMQFYDMEAVVGTSSMTHGLKEAHQPFASALTTTQPKALKTLLSKADAASGFLNRWVFVPGKEKQRFAIGGVRVDMTPAVKPLQDILGWAASFGADEYVEWSPEAAEAFTDFFHKRIEIDKRKLDNDMITRVDLLMKKLILLFTANRQLRTVPIESVEDAIACYDYIIASYGIPADQIGNSLANEISEAIMHQALRQYERDKKGVTLNQIAKALKRRKYPNDLLLKTADALVKLGFLQLETPKNGSVGRPTTRYKYVD